MTFLRRVREIPENNRTYSTLWGEARRKRIEKGALAFEVAKAYATVRKKDRSGYEIA